MSIAYDPRVESGLEMTDQDLEFAEDTELAGDEEVANVRNLLRKIQANIKSVQTETKMSLIR